MKLSSKPFVIGNILPILCVSVFLGFFSSCSNDDEVKSPEINANDPTRKTFATLAEFDDFLESFKEEKVSTAPNPYSPDDELSIIESYIRYTAIGSILNEKLEYQVEDKIYKLGKSGYSTYVIEFSKYSDALKIVENENNIIKSIGSFEISKDGAYKISNGVDLYYDGEPIIVVEKPNTPDLKVSMDGRTKVQTAFWQSKNPIKSECGVQVEAWSRPNTNTDWQSANTDLSVGFSVGINIPLAPFPQPFSGRLAAKGNKIKESIYWCTGYYSFDLYHPSVIDGGAKCWDGSWIYASVTK